MGICLTFESEDSSSLCLHYVVGEGGYKSKNLITSIIFNTMKTIYLSDNDYVFSRTLGDVRDMFGGGIIAKNKEGLTPLTMIYGLVDYHVARQPNHPRWVWLTTLIRSVVHLQLHYFNKSNKENPNINFTAPNFFDNPEELSKTPLLHAALELGCPLGLINRILDSTTVDGFCECDSFGRTPLDIALKNKNTVAEVIIKLFNRTPVEVTQKSNLPLHHVIKRAIKFHGKSKSEDEILLIGTIVENFSHTMDMPDGELGIPPFMLASMDNTWSLDVIYCLLRTAPGAIESYH